MSTVNIIIVVGIVVIVFGWGLWFTFSKFKNIEKGETGRREHIDKDMEVEDHKTKTK